MRSLFLSLLLVYGRKKVSFRTIVVTEQARLSYKNRFLVGMKNSMRKKIEEAKGENREIMEEIADLLLEPSVDYTNLEKIEIPNGMTDISLSAVEGETGFSSENLNVSGIVIPEKL